MATRRELVHVDFGKNQIQNVVVQPLSGPPSTPIDGQIYYDTTLGQFGSRQNGSWVYLAAGGTDTEAVQDVVAALLTPGSIVTATYNDAANTLTLGIGAGVITNAMVSNSAAISADKLADGTNNVIMTTAERNKLAGIATGATAYTDTQARANRLDQFAAPTAAVSLNSQNITNLLDPTSAQMAATKNYVDTQNNSQSTTDRARANHTGTQTASTISDFDTQVRTSRLDQLAVPTTSVALNGQRMTGAGDPIAASDLATKSYADSIAAGFDPKASVRVATTGNITLSGLQTIDTVTVVAGDRVLVKNQTTAADNGIYIAASGGWTRATDADTSAEVTSGLRTFVEDGSVNKSQNWILITTGTITLGTTALTFSQDSGASAVTAGAGLVPTGNTFNVGQGTGIIVAADAISVDFSKVTGKAAATIGDGTTTSFVITHGLNTQDITAAVQDTATKEIVNAQVLATSTTTATVNFNTPPAANAFRVTIHG